MSDRRATLVRETKETKVRVSIDLYEPGKVSVNTGIPFLDHMLDAFALHGRFGLSVEAKGDVEVDPHHVVEDIGMVLGASVGQALTGAGPVARAGYFVFPMDGSLAQISLDLCGRPNLIWRVELGDSRIGIFDPKLTRDFFKGFVDSARATLHAHVPYKDGDHHAIEALFKAFGRALRDAATSAGDKTMSTKGQVDA